MYEKGYLYSYFSSLFVYSFVYLFKYTKGLNYILSFLCIYLFMCLSIYLILCLCTKVAKQNAEKIYDKE